MEERLNRILAEFGLNSSQLAEKMGIQRSGISHIMAGRNKPSYDFLVTLIGLFPELNANWLLTGKGEMLKPAKGEIRGDTDNETSLSHSQNIQHDLFSASATSNKEEKASVKPPENAGLPPQAEDTSEKSKSGGEEVESVLVLYSDGRFRRYRKD